MRPALVITDQDGNPFLPVIPEKLELLTSTPERRAALEKWEKREEEYQLSLQDKIVQEPLWLWGSPSVLENPRYQSAATSPVITGTIGKDRQEMKIHALNREYLKNEAARIREDQAQSGGGDRDLAWYEWQPGENHLRIFPPYSAKGLIFRRVLSHFELPPDRSIARCMHTWPEKYDLCYVCEGLEKVIAQIPEADLGRLMSNAHFYANVIDRNNEDKGVQIARFTESLYNWITLQIDNPKIGDITDYEKGYDVLITKTEKKRRGGGTSTRYVPSFMPGATPIHEKDEIVTKWLGQAFDLDRVFGPLTDEQIGELQKTASAMVSYYMRKKRDDYTAATDAESRASQASQAAEPARREPAQPAARREPAVSTKAPPQEAKAEPAAASPGRTLDEIDPKGKPACFAGLKTPEKHGDGSTGFNEELEKCLACPVELECLAAKLERGL